ncbi:DUF1259 domain-containing protein [Streptomyces sp. NPDC003753]|uniref:DUF1259 domain-containing protein n=1 Tax=unclassified Streptomyces TaxID=2593676 RepID=UPI001906C4CB|nr:DUF1259 domain-containing protein [Streptomyces sp. Y2F8-2]GHK00305.1 peptidase M23 [Streptomyces sp. Y2F8-2]
MMAEDPQQDTHGRAVAPRRRVLAAAAALAPALAVAQQAPARALSAPADHRHGDAVVRPVRTTLSDWTDVAKALGRGGDMKRNLMYHTGLPRHDLSVISKGVLIKPELALGSHVSFVRYADGSTMTMGDLVVTEQELQPFLDVLHQQGLAVTALHKHLLSHTPNVWWAHVHAHGHDPVAVARGLRAAFDRTGTPRPQRPAKSSHTLDTAAIDAALGVKGSYDDGIYKSLFIRRETIVEGGMVLPPGLGSTTAFNWQPLGAGRVAISGDLAMVAGEVQDVLAALRRARMELVELHNHGLRDEPRLFFTHFWAVGNAVTLARGLRAAVDATNVAPASVG